VDNGSTQSVQDVFYAPSLETAKERAAKVLHDYQKEHPAAMRSFNDELAACLVYLHCPLAHHKAIRTTNLLEHAFVYLCQPFYRKQRT
jgi:transposase-like protein